MMKDGRCTVMSKYNGPYRLHFPDDRLERERGRDFFIFCFCSTEEIQKAAKVHSGFLTLK
jgi:hypothetical protein